MIITPAKPLHLELHSSQQMTSLISFVHLVALVCVGLYAVDLSIKLILLLIVIAHAFYVYRYYAKLAHPRSILAIEMNTEERWHLRDAQQWQTAELLGSSVVTQYLIVLNFKTKKFLNTSVVLLRDSVSQEQWRSLRVYLNTH